MKKKTAIVINDNPPISIKNAITIFPNTESSDATLHTVNPVTHTQDVDINNESTNPKDSLDGVEIGNTKKIAPNKTTATNVKIICKYG